MASDRPDRAGVLLPQVREQPAGCVPGSGDARDHARLHDDGGRPEHRRRLRGSPRPRLRGLLRGRRVHRGLVRLAPVRAGHVPLRLGRDQPGGGRDPHLDLARAPDRRQPDRARGDPDRPADPAPAWGLPRDRDARLRRDHPAVRQERRQHLRLRPHPRHVRDQPHRLTGLRGDDRGCDRPSRELPAVLRAGAVVLLGRSRPAPVHRLLLGPSARLAPRAGVDRDPRGRDCRGRDGSPPDADEDVGLRDRRLLRWRRGLLLLHVQERRLPERLLLQHLRLPALHGDPGRHGLGLGRRPRRPDPLLPRPGGARQAGQLRQRRDRASDRRPQVQLRRLRADHRADDALPSDGVDSRTAPQEGALGGRSRRVAVRRER